LQLNQRAQRSVRPGSDLSNDSLDDITLYIQWLYSGYIDINIKSTKGEPSEERNEEAEAHFMALVKVLVFGGKVMDTAFNKAILEMLIQVQVLYRWIPGSEVFCTLYDGTTAGCLARRLMTQFVACNVYVGGESKWPTILEGYPRELLIDVVTAMAGLRDRNLVNPWRKMGLRYLDMIS
jgi:hypothetical protein